MGLLDTKRAFIIGGSYGIGRATANLFAREGARVVIGSRSDKGEEAAKDLRDKGHDASFVRVDISDKASVDNAVSKAVDFLGGLDIFITTPFAPSNPDILTLTRDWWYRQLDTQLTGNIYAFQAVIPVMQKQGGGVIIATSSAHFTDYGIVNHTAVVPEYAMCKGAMELLVKSAARIHAPDGIRINAVQPTFTPTEGIQAFLDQGNVTLDMVAGFMMPTLPMGLFSADDAAEGYLFLASDYASYITGYSLAVDGGSLAFNWGKLSA